MHIVPAASLDSSLGGTFSFTPPPVASHPWPSPSRAPLSREEGSEGTPREGIILLRQHFNPAAPSPVARKAERQSGSRERHRQNPLPGFLQRAKQELRKIGSGEQCKKQLKNSLYSTLNKRRESRTTWRLNALHTQEKWTVLTECQP
ncbi:hypothetical protein E2320_004452 [Naja naja]|nr:hypothetical protein E2320_004452 [Naja naja]